MTNIATTLKALRVMLSAQGHFIKAIAAYQRALQIGPQAWQV